MFWDELVWMAMTDRLPEDSQATTSGDAVAPPPVPHDEDDNGLVGPNGDYVLGTLR